MDPGFECQKQPALCSLIPEKDLEKRHEQKKEPPLIGCLDHIFNLPKSFPSLQ